VTGPDSGSQTIRLNTGQGTPSGNISLPDIGGNDVSPIRYIPNACGLADVAGAGPSEGGNGDLTAHDNLVHQPIDGTVLKIF